MQTWMFDFANNPTMAGVPSMILEKSVGDGYVNGVGPGTIFLVYVQRIAANILSRCISVSDYGSSCERQYMVFMRSSI